MQSLNFKSVALHSFESAVIIASAILVTHVFGWTGDVKTWALAVCMAAVAKLVRELNHDYVNK